jgi:hypothetical protein
MIFFNRIQSEVLIKMKIKKSSKNRQQQNQQNEFFASHEELLD